MKIKGGKLLTVLIMSVLLTAPFTDLAEKIGGGYSDWWSNVLGAFGVMKADAATEIKPLQEGEIPSVYLEGTLPIDKTETVMRYTFESETQIFEGYCKIKCQGSTSLGYAKKNFTIKTFTDSECTQKAKIRFRNWKAKNKFCYKANWIDFTHARNIVCARLWGEMLESRSNYESLPTELKTAPNHGAIDGFFVKMYVNGVYYGRYTLNIPKDAWMANLDETNANHAMVMSETCFDSGIFRSTALLDGSDWTDELHDTVPENIKTRWNEVIRFINEASDEKFYNNIDNYIDIQSVIDYDVFCVVLCGIDSFGKNQMFLTYDGQKWYMSVYDLDSMLGLQWNGSELLPANYPRGAFTDLNRNLLINRVEKLFGKEIAARYREVSQRELSVEHICSSFEEFMADCPQELVEADRVFTSVSGEKIEAPLADTNTLAFIQQFVAERKAYNDQYFEKLARGELFSQGKTDRFGTRIFSLIEPYWSDGYELVDTPWAPYHDDSDWTLALKFKDDIVPDGKYSAIMTAHQGSSPLKLHLKCLTTDGKTTYQLIMGAGAGFSLSEDQFFSWVGGEPSKDGHHYLILAKHGDSYDIFYDGSILQNYGAPIGDVRSDATLQLFATDVGENVLLEKTSGTIEVLRVYDSALTRDECFKLYRELQTPW